MLSVILYHYKCNVEGKVSDRDDDNDEIIIRTTTIQ